MWIAFGMLFGLLAAPPVDVTRRMQLAPGKVSLNLEKNLILGDPKNAVLPVLKTRLPAMEACLQRVGPALTSGKGPRAMDIRISPQGALEMVRISGSARTNTCLRTALKGVRFPAGRKRMGIVDLAIARPAPLRIAPAVDTLVWTAPGDRLGFTVRAQRVQTPDGRWRLDLEADIRADGLPRGIGAGSLRHNHSYLTRQKRTKNGFSLQTSAGAERCLKPGESATRTSKGVHAIAQGEQYSAQVFILAGDCKTGTGRYEIGTVQLDARNGMPPELRAIPTWSYQLHARHR